MSVLWQQLRQHSESRRTRESQQLCPVAAPGPCGADADTQDECPVRGKSTEGSDNWRKAPSHGSHPLEAPESSLACLWVSLEPKTKKDMCLLVTKRIIWSICEIPLESWEFGLRVGDMIIAESSQSWWKPQVFNITINSLVLCSLESGTWPGEREQVAWRYTDYLWQKVVSVCNSTWHTDIQIFIAKSREEVPLFNVNYFWMSPGTTCDQKPCVTCMFIIWFRILLNAGSGICAHL